MFRIGAFAQLAGVSAKMLRAWDALGLFRPVWVDQATGYRWYSPAQLPELRRILALRDVGVPLADIAALVAGGADLGAVLLRRRMELERERREVDRRLRALDITVAVAGPGGGVGRLDGLDVVVRPVTAEPVATLAVDPANGDVEHAFYVLEAHVRDVGVRASRPPGMLIDRGAVGHAAEVFVPLTRHLEPAEPIGYRRLPAGRAASIIHRGSYAGLAATQAALDRWVAAAGLTATGSLRILYLQFGAETELRVPRAYLVDRDADFVTELQQPVA